MTDDNAQTWHDPADQLTPKQLANVQKTENLLVELFPMTTTPRAC